MAGAPLVKLKAMTNKLVIIGIGSVNMQHIGAGDFTLRRCLFINNGIPRLHQPNLQTVKTGWEILNAVICACGTSVVEQR